VTIVAAFEGRGRYYRVECAACRKRVRRDAFLFTCKECGELDLDCVVYVALSDAEGVKDPGAVRVFEGTLADESAGRRLSLPA